MIKKILCCILLTTLSIHAASNIAHHRYTAMLPLLTKFKREITVALLDDSFDIAHALAKKHRAVPALITTDWDNAILKRCIAHKAPILLLKKQPDLEALAILGDCEHFDVTCAFSVIKQYGSLWQQAVMRIIRLADYTFIESTLPEHVRFLQELNGEIVADYNDVKLWLIHKEKKYLLRRSWFYLATNNKMYAIKSTFNAKELVKDKGFIETTPWIAGINLQTFKELNGIYPTHAMIREHITSLKSIAHNDMAIFNIVIRPEGLVPIDSNEQGRTRWLRFAIREVLKEFRG